MQHTTRQSCWAAKLRASAILDRHLLRGREEGLVPDGGGAVVRSSSWEKTSENLQSGTVC